MTSIATIKSAVAQFAEECRDQGAIVDKRDADWLALYDDVENEYDKGATGSVLDVIRDLHDTVGLEEFGIFIE